MSPLPSRAWKVLLVQYIMIFFTEETLEFKIISMPTQNMKQMYLLKSY